MLLPKFEYLAPRNVDELLDFLEKHQENAKILAGGTDIIPNMLGNLYQVNYLIDIGKVDGMKGITYEQGKGLAVGAATKLKDLEKSELVQKKYPALAKAAGEIGSPQVRAMATLGGNCCNASPAADTPPALVALGAVVSVVGKTGHREMLLEDFIQGNRITDLKPGEYLSKFLIPDLIPGSACRFGLITLRQGVEIDIASLAVYLVLDKNGVVDDVRISMGSVAPIPLRAVDTEDFLKGKKLDEKTIEKAALICSGEAKPIDDIRASASYRRHLIGVLTTRVINETLEAIQ